MSDGDARREDVVAAMLSRYPGPLTLNGDRLRWFIWLAGAFAFFVTGVVTWPRGWPLLLVGTPGAIAALVMLFTPGIAAMTLDRNGVSFRTAFYGGAYRWADVHSIRARLLGGMSWLDYRSPRYVEFVTVDPQAADVQRKIVIPNRYGMTVDELASLLSAWRERALSDHE